MFLDDMRGVGRGALHLLTKLVSIEVTGTVSYRNDRTIEGIDVTLLRLIDQNGKVHNGVIADHDGPLNCGQEVNLYLQRGWASLHQIDGEYWWQILGYRTL